MRRLIQGLLETLDPTALPAGKILQGGVVDSQPTFPFCVHRYRVTTGTPSGRGRPGLEVWFYDAPGSYLQIDRLLKATRLLFSGASDLVSLDGTEHISQIEWTGDSPDLPAEEYHGITRAATFNLIGRSA